MAISNKLIGEQISAKTDLVQTGTDSNNNIVLSKFSTVSSQSVFLQQTTNTTCDTTFLKEGNNPLNQVSAKSSMTQISMKNLFGLRNKIWCGMVPDEQNVAPGPGLKFSGANINSVEIPPGVSNIDTFLVGGGGGSGGIDSNTHGGAGGSGCIVSTNCDLTPFGNLDKTRKIITVAGGGGFFGSTSRYIGGLPGSGLAIVDQDPGTGWGEMKNVCVSYPHNRMVDWGLTLHGCTNTESGWSEFNIILYFYGNLAKQQNYYFKGRADDIAKIYDITSDANVTKLNSGDFSNPILEIDITTNKVNTMTKWVVDGNGTSVSSNIRVLRVLLGNTSINSPSHFALKLYDESGNEVWNTRKRDGIGFFNFPHQGGRGGTSGRRGGSGGGGGGGGASFVAIESPAYSGNLSLVAIAGGGGGGAGGGNEAPSVTPDSRQAQVNYQYDPILKDNTFVLSQQSAFYSVSPYGQSSDPVYTLQYTNATIQGFPYGGVGDFDYGGAGGGGGGGGKCGSLYLYTDHLGNPVSWLGVSSTGGSNGISGTWVKNLYNDRLTISDSGIHFSYYPSVIDGRTGLQKFNIGSANKVPKYSSGPDLWTGAAIQDFYKTTPGMGGQRTEVVQVQNNGNMGFAYVEWDAGLQYSAPKGWQLYIDGHQNGIVYSKITNQSGTISTNCLIMSPSIQTNQSGFSMTVSKHSGDDIIIAPLAGHQHAFVITASSTVYPKITSGIIKVNATYNGESKLFYFGYILEWKIDYLGNAGATYVINTPEPTGNDQHGTG